MYRLMITFYQKLCNIITTIASIFTEDYLITSWLLSGSGKVIPFIDNSYGYCERVRDAIVYSPRECDFLRQKALREAEIARTRLKLKDEKDCDYLEALEEENLELYDEKILEIESMNIEPKYYRHWYSPVQKRSMKLLVDNNCYNAADTLFKLWNNAHDLEMKLKEPTDYWKRKNPIRARRGW